MLTNAERSGVARYSEWLLERRFRLVVVLVIQCAVVVTCVGLTAYAAARVQERQVREATTERVLAVARSLAELDQVRDAIGSDDAEQELQPLTELIQQASGVDYVVISDARGIRITHPVPDERGRPVSTDPSDVLAGATFVGTEEGTLGPTLRAKVPVYRGGVVVGAASVGVLESEIAADLRTSLTAMAPWVLLAMVVGLTGAAGVSAAIGARVRRLEAENAELGEQRRLSRALREQTHEFRTRIHAVYGLVESGESDAALEYLAELAPVTGADTRDGGVEDPRLRAVLGEMAAEYRSQGGVLEIDPLTSTSAGELGADDVSLIANLVINAVEAAGPGGHVHVLVLADEVGTEVAVADDGPGLDPEALPMMMEHGYSTKAPGGERATRGVGLAVVWQIVRDRDGEIEVGRSPAGGALVTVRLRRRR
ncbi:ATP-binding protein [Dietzia sp. UCD-THP]|uniref:sensor histidine kinase n=1 Tax=Dietzia sp. UCD-THP TaxID=1292020 RepID=UPI0009DB5A03|nr:ATP-binding protein [Dietzia sp. UCD-THP]